MLGILLADRSNYLLEIMQELILSNSLAGSPIVVSKHRQGLRRLWGIVHK